MTTAVPVEPQWLRVGVRSSIVGVDREAKVIRGYVLAQEGEFHDSRGVFDQKSLKKLVTLARQKKQGLKSRFTHPSLSGDGLGTFLGRAKNVHMDTVTVERDGEITSLLAVRGDLHFSGSAFNTPNGDLATYVMDLAEEDSDALSSSVVLMYEEEHQLDEHGKPNLNVPALWRPTALHASDIVDEGAAVDGLLSAEINADGLSDGLVRKGCELLNGFLPGQSRDVVEARATAWLSRALDLRFGDEVEDVAEEPAKCLGLPKNQAALMYRKRKGASCGASGEASAG